MDYVNLYVATATFLTCALAAGTRMLGPGADKRAPLRVFISYSRRDEPYRAALAGHVRNLSESDLWRAGMTEKYGRVMIGRANRNQLEIR